MDIIYDAMFYLLKGIKTFLDTLGVGGGYALAIIVLTTALRVILWPLNSSQTRSMQKMQELQPKIKDLQTKYKDNPQKMQEQLMTFYAEHKFNPLAGCLPMLLQLPIFIGLYGMLTSPDFLGVVGNERFLFIDHLALPLFSHAGKALDEQFNIQEKDHFATGKWIHITFQSGSSNDYHIRDPKKVLEIQPTPLIPGEPMTMTLNAAYLGEEGFPEAFVQKIKAAKLFVVNDVTKELEELTFEPTPPVAAAHEKADLSRPTTMAWHLTSTLKTQKGEKQVHTGVLYLILLYAAITVLYQKVMTKASTAPQEGPQAQMMKLMPLMFVGFLVFLPIPAGVILYLVVTMLLMLVQTWWIQWSDSNKNGDKTPPSTVVLDVQPEK